MGHAVAVCGHDPPFASDEQLRRRQTEDLRSGSRTNRAAMHAGPEAVGGVDDQREAVLIGNRLQGGDVTRVAEIVAGGDGHRSRRDRSADGLGRDVGRARINLHEHGPKVVPHDRGCCGQERETWHHHFTERLGATTRAHHAEPRQRLHRCDGAWIDRRTAAAATPSGEIERPVDEHQAHRAAAHGHRVPHAKPLGDRLLQPFAVRPLREPPALQDVLKGRLQTVGRRKRRPHERHADALIRRIARSMNFGHKLKRFALH